MPYAVTGGYSEPAGSGGFGCPPSQMLIIHPFSRYIYVKAGPVMMTGPVLHHEQPGKCRHAIQPRKNGH